MFEEFGHWNYQSLRDDQHTVVKNLKIVHMFQLTLPQGSLID